MIFDSANPTGYDWDLGSPNTDFGGPGRGAGGEEGQPGENRWPLGNVLILSEDGDQDDPDDYYAGGTFIFTFQAPVKVHEVQLLDIDIDETDGTILVFDASDTKLGMYTMQPFGNNSVQNVLIDLENVSRLEIQLESSGAVASVSFCDPEPNPDDPTPEVTPEPTEETTPVATKPPNLNVSSCLVKDEDLFRFKISNNGADGEYRLRAYSGEILGPWPIENGKSIGGTTEEKALSTELEATWLKEYLSDNYWVNAGGLHITSLQGHAEHGYFCNAEGQEPTDEPQETLTPDPSPSPDVTESPQPVPTKPDETPIPSPVVTEDPKSPPTNRPTVKLGPDLSISEGETLRLVGNIQDPDSNSWTAKVDYGVDRAGKTLDVDDQGNFSLEHIYGDDGIYLIQVIVTDDQGNSGSDEINLEVVNVAPEVELAETDDTGDCKPKGDDDGVKRNYCRNGFWATVNVGDKIELHASAEDPGSDDLVFTWNSDESATYFNNGASSDGNPSPDGKFPFGADDQFIISFDEAGVHKVSLIVKDDDGGDTEITIRVKVIEVRECVGSLGFWKHQFAENGSHQIDDDELGRYLDLIENKSGYFNDFWGAISSEEAHNILSFSDNDFRAKVRAHLLSAWLNYAKGSVDWDDKIGLDKDTREWRFDRLVARVESILSNSEASASDYQYAKDLAEAVSMLQKERSKCSYTVSKD
ncbi:MAG: PKD domain-containing protein [Anaerolineales bacterium]